MTSSPGKLMAIGAAHLGGNVPRQAVLARYEQYLVAGVSHASGIDKTLSDIFTRDNQFGDQTALAAAFDHPAYVESNAQAHNDHVPWRLAHQTTFQYPHEEAAARLGGLLRNPFVARQAFKPWEHTRTQRARWASAAGAATSSGNWRRR